MTSAPPIDALQRKTEELARSEERYRYALMAGRLVHWETDLTTGTRIWREDSMALFGLKLENGIGRLGGEDDEFRKAVHPEDRPLVAKVYELAQTQDWFPVEYRIVRTDPSRQESARGDSGHRLANRAALRHDRGIPGKFLQAPAGIGGVARSFGDAELEGRLARRPFARSTRRFRQHRQFGHCTLRTGGLPQSADHGIPWPCLA